MELLEIINPEAVRNNFEGIGRFDRISPSIIMVASTSKLFIFLICNILFAVVITKSGWSFSKSNEPNINYQSAIMAAKVNSAFEPENSHDKQQQQQQHRQQLEATEEEEVNQTSLHEIQPSAQNNGTEDRYHDTARSIDYIYPHQVYAKSSKQKTQPDDDQRNDFRIQRPTITQQQIQQQQQKQRNSSAERPSAPPNYQNHTSIVDNEIENRMSRFNEVNGNGARNSSNDHQYASINFQQQQNKRPVPPPKPVTNKFLLQVTGHEEPIQYRPDSRMSNSRVERSSSHMKAPEELRSQLPWSYFKPGDNVPKRALTHIADDDEPQVPVPDYNAPAKRNTRNHNEMNGDEWRSQRY